MNDWISVKDSMPKMDVVVLIFAPSEDPDCPLMDIAMRVESAEGDGGRWMMHIWQFAKSITHWRPLPEPPCQPTT